MSPAVIRAVVVGQPNVGKSSLINTISGASLHVGNFSGVTVEKKEVHFRSDGFAVTMVDLPGLYSLHAYTPEEHVSKNYLLSGEYDLIVNVVDGNALGRNLALTLQLLEMGKKMIVVVNMIDEVKKLGGSVDAIGMSSLLGVPVILASSKTRLGIELFTRAIVDAYRNPAAAGKIYYDEKIESEIEPLAQILACDPVFAQNPRHAVIRLLERDEELYRAVHDRPVFLEFHEAFGRAGERLKIEFDEHDTLDVIQNARVAAVRGIVSATVRARGKDSVTQKIDRVLIHPVLGLPIFLFFMWSLFQLTFAVGSIPMEYIDAAFSNLGRFLGTILPRSPFSTALVEGAVPAVGAIMMFLPNILILFLGINLLEQTGYMARSAFLLDGFMKKFGLQGKAFIPLVSGFGCSVPAYMAARTLKNPKDRLITMLIIGFFSCSARLPVYVLFIAAFFPAGSAGNVLFAIYISGAILGMVMAKILRTVLFKGEAEPFVMEMPKYRFPSFRAIVMDLRIKTFLFIKKAGTFIAGASMAIWFLSSYPADPVSAAPIEAKIAHTTDAAAKEALQSRLAAVRLEESYLGSFGKMIEPVFAPLGFDWRLSVATVSALAAKEVAVSTLATLYSVGDSERHQDSLISQIRQTIDFKTAIALIVIIMIYSPCFAAMGTFYAEIRPWQWRLFYTVYPNVVAWILAFFAYKTLSLMGY